MAQKLIAYAVTTILFLGMDFIWLSVSGTLIYKRYIGALMLDKPNLPVAAAFYLIYVVGVVVFAVLPALDTANWMRALWAGALLGLVAYGTYDMTNLATLRGWSCVVSLVDMAWGTLVTGVAATASYFILRQIQ